MDIAFLTAALLVLTFLSGYYSCSEAALFSLSPLRVKAYSGDNDPVKRLIARLVLRPKDLLVTVFLLNTFVNILLQNTASHMFGREASWLLSVGVPFLLTFFLGELIPKYIGLRNNISLSYFFAPQLIYIHNLLAPVRRAIIKITLPISRLFFSFFKEEPTISRGELKHVLKSSEEHGILSRDEAKLVWGYLDLLDCQVSELMRRREEIAYYNIHEPIARLISLFDRGYSRLPVCDGGLESIVGVIYADDFFLHGKQMVDPQELMKITLKPFYVPETTVAVWLLRRFEVENEFFAIAVNEYGAVAGIVTREDILEVVVGPLVDTRDSRKRYTRTGNNQLIASGRLEIAELNELLQVELHSNYMTTIGGWLTEQMGQIPQVGTIYSFQGLFFQVLSASANRVRRLYIRKEQAE